MDALLLCVCQRTAHGGMICGSRFIELPPRWAFNCSGCADAISRAESWKDVDPSRGRLVGSTGMADNSSIEWTDATWNPMTGCTKVSAGCDHCYASTLAHRPILTGVYSKMLPVKDTPANRADSFAPRFWEERLEQPLKWREPRRVFVNSM